MFYWLLNLTWIATSFDVGGLASLVFKLTGMPHHLTRGISLGIKVFKHRGYLHYLENMGNICDQMTPYPLLEIANDERYSPASVLTLKVHPLVIGVFPLDRGSPDMSLHLEKWLIKEETDVLDFNKVINTTAFVLHSSTHDKESAATYPKGSNKGRIRALLHGIIPNQDLIWKFVLPIKKLDHICPSVFKIASLMAHGEKLALAIPILASIYRGLTTSTNLGAGDIIFPYNMSMDGLNVDICSLPTLAMIQPKELFIAENRELSSSWNDYFISLRSSYITLRCDDFFVMEPYSPHRFSRRFGFVQDLPGNFIKRPHDATLQELVRLWDSCTRLSSFLSISIPPRPERPLTTNRYENW
ncbi:hypothetical protein T459_00821 [Capsicum annuum]|uniref:Aminotransferase-like plant mobile domain-containing protein n=1 Tax=Capsicum annuum TaxID=4072 RepID=A0A2G3AFD0_CAPAN|nr:hypothetical protein FXO37_15833 [Capsicum annuum]PHT92939.1 hypothetical protein T459_00821 [Capsicum annuum]